MDWIGLVFFFQIKVIILFILGTVTDILFLWYLFQYKFKVCDIRGQDNR